MLDPDQQSIVSTRFNEAMRTRFLTNGRFDFSLTNEWPIDPKQDYPMVTAEPPPKEWHFSATTGKLAKRHRIAAIMFVRDNGVYPVCEIKSDHGHVYFNGQSGEDTWSGIINLSTDGGREDFLLDLEYLPSSGKAETIRIPDKR
jgi:hypothetical protein